MTALPDLNLPWKKGVVSHSLAALGEVVFNAGIKDSTTSLVDADVAASNVAFGARDCENALDYHLRALALLLDTRYKVRPLHLTTAFDVTSLYTLRKLGYSQKPSRGATKAAEVRWAQVIFFKKSSVAEICSALGFTEEAKAAVGPTSEGWSSALKVERCLPDGSPAADASFWEAIRTGPDKQGRVTQACFQVVRVLAGASSSGSGGTASAPPAPAPAPAPAPSATADSMYDQMFGFLSGDALVQAKAMTLQLIYPKNRRYENGGLVRAGAFDAVLKSWVEAKLSVLVHATNGVPIADMGDMLQLVFTVVDLDAVPLTDGGGSGGGGGGSGSGDGGGKSSTDDLARAIDGTRLPSVKGEDGHERLVPLPGGMLPLVQAESLVAKRDILA